MRRMDDAEDADGVCTLYVLYVCMYVCHLIIIVWNHG